MGASIWAYLIKASRLAERFLDSSTPHREEEPNHDKRLVSSHWFDHLAWTSPLVLEVVTLFDVCDQCRPLRPPSQTLLGQCARRRIVQRHHGGKKAEVVACFLGDDADNRQLQLAADDLSDVPERHALLAASVQSRASRGGFHGQPEQVRRIESMHGGPAVRAVTNVG